MLSRFPPEDVPSIVAPNVPSGTMIYRRRSVIAQLFPNVDCGRIGNCSVQGLAISRSEASFVALFTQPQIQNLYFRIVTGLLHHFGQEAKPWRKLSPGRIKRRLVVKPAIAKSKAIIPGHRLTVYQQSRQCQPACV